jgi:hypothetical protein
MAEAEALRAAYAAYRDAAAFLARVPWRQGRSNPCNIYARIGGDDWKADWPMGSQPTPELARQACSAHNASLASDLIAG